MKWVLSDINDSWLKLGKEHLRNVLKYLKFWYEQNKNLHQLTGIISKTEIDRLGLITKWDHRLLKANAIKHMGLEAFTFTITFKDYYKDQMMVFFDFTCCTLKWTAAVLVLKLYHMICTKQQWSCDVASSFWQWLHAEAIITPFLIGGGA